MKDGKRKDVIETYRWMLLQLHEKIHRSASACTGTSDVERLCRISRRLDVACRLSKCSTFFESMDEEDIASFFEDVAHWALHPADGRSDETVRQGHC